MENSIGYLIVIVIIVLGLDNILEGINNMRLKKIVKEQSKLIDDQQELIKKQELIIKLKEQNDGNKEK